jgi:putative transposase
MSYVKIWLHCVWGTKNRLPLLREEIRKDVHDHIKANSIDKGIYLDSINGHSDHIHCLISLNADQTLAHVVQLMKGESSFWINKNKLTESKFEWAVDYFAVSLSESHLPRVRNYIRTQEEHHRKMTWEEEYTKFLKEYGFIQVQG